MTFRQKLQNRAKKAITTHVIKKFSPYEVLLAPIMTEKSHAMQQDQHKYVFKVHKDANKNDVKEAIAYIYKVQPLKINMLNAKAKGRQQRAVVKKAFKKAIVTLGEKDKIDLGI